VVGLVKSRHRDCRRVPFEKNTFKHYGVYLRLLGKLVGCISGW